MRMLLSILTLSFFHGVIAQDSIKVNNTVTFGIYDGYGDGAFEEVRFRMTVINNSSNDIPDLGVTNRSEHVNFYINGEVNNPVSMYNGLESMYGEKTIAPGDKAIYDNVWVLTEDAGIVETYGNEFSIQWEYMGIKSPVIFVNLENKTFLYDEPVKDEPVKSIPKINPDREGEFNYLVSHADKRYRNKQYLQAQEFYIMAWRIYMYDDYVNDQIEICEEKTGKIIP